MNDPTKIGTAVTRQEIPREEIVEASKHHFQVRIGIKRRDSKNRWSYVTSNIVMDTIDLLNIHEWIFERAGGGDYRFEVEAADDPTVEPIKPFMVFREGPPKRFSQPGDSPVNDGRHGDEGEEGASGAVSRIAVESRREARRDIEHERKKREEAERAAATRERALTEENNRLREEGRDREARAREDAHRAELSAVREAIAQMRNQPPPAPARPPMDLAGVITAVASITAALAPIATAMISAGATRKSSELESQRLLMQGQTDMFKAMVLQKPQESELMKLLPTILPLMKGFMSERDPAKQAEMWGVLGDQMLTQAQLAGDMMRSFAEAQPDQPAWMSVATELFGGIERYAKMIYETQTGKPAGGGGGQHEEQPTEIVHGGAPQGAMSASSDGVPPPPRPASAPAAGLSQQEKLNHVMPQLPVHFQNQEWAEIVYFMLMGDTANIGGIGGAIVDVLAKLQEAGAVPPDLYPVYEDATQIGPLFIDLVPEPRPGYREKVLKATLSAMRQPSANGSGPSGRVAPPDEAPQPARVM